tara:strand:+ start:2777 stop:3490 length:714 start_codon:yes stop_codon:yes gene_type:complete
MAENIFINLDADSLASARVTSLTNNTAKPFKKFIAGDIRDLNIYVTDGAGAYADLSSTNLRVGVGGINLRPTGGTWVFTHGGSDATIDYNESAASLEAVLDAAPYSLAVSVTAPTVGVWIVKFDAVGAQTLPTATTSNLTPDSTIAIDRLVTGDGSTKEEWILRTFQTPWAFQATWSDITNGKNASLDFTTENLYAALADADSLSSFFEVELTDGSGNVDTIIQAPVSIGTGVVGKA